MRPSSIRYRDAGCWNSTNQSCLFVHDCADFGLHEDYVRYVCPMLQIAVKAAKAVKTLFSVFAKAMRTTCFSAFKKLPTVARLKRVPTTQRLLLLLVGVQRKMVLVTVPQKVLGKVIFSQVSVCPQGVSCSF